MSNESGNKSGNKSGNECRNALMPCLNNEIKTYHIYGKEPLIEDENNDPLFHYDNTNKILRINIYNIGSGEDKDINIKTIFEQILKHIKENNKDLSVSLTRYTKKTDRRKPDISEPYTINVNELSELEYDDLNVLSMNNGENIHLSPYTYYKIVYGIIQIEEKRIKTDGGKKKIIKK